MDRVAGAVVLQDQHTGAFDVIGIILQHNRLLNTGNNLTGQDSIRSQFVVAMIRNPDFALGKKLLNSAKSPAHLLILDPPRVISKGHP